MKMVTKNEARDAVIIWLFSEFLFHLFLLLVEELSLCFQFFLLIAILCFVFYSSAMTNNQTKCGIIYKKNLRMINYEWPNVKGGLSAWMT